MALDLRDCTFFGPALPEPFVKFELEKHLHERQLLPRADGAEGRALQERWEVYRRKLRSLGEQGGDLRVASHVLAPLVERLGYATFERQAEVGTREGLEDGGWLMSGAESSLRCWSVDLGTDLDAPNLRGRAYRFSPARVAQRVLLAQGERVGLLTDGEELRILICDPARPDSFVAIRLDQSNGWRAAREAPDSYRLLLALVSPLGTKAVSDLTEAARLAQATVTRKLRVQARRAIEDFIQSVLDQPANAPERATTDAAELAKTLWQEGLVLVYRLLFVFKLEASADPARAFSFAATSLWQNTYSPNLALAPLVSKVLDDGAETGGLLEGGLRVLWRMFAKGLSSRELQVSALGGMLFGEGATPLLDRLHWGETAVAKLLDALLWTPAEGRVERERVHYGALDVEDLGRVYEALLELEPGVATEPMCRLRRAKLEVVVPAAQGEVYRANPVEGVTPAEAEFGSDDEDAEEEEESASPRKRSQAGGKTKVQFIESIPAGRFYLRVGLGRKGSGSYYTPHPFVRFLVQETLGPQIAERSPQADPQPGRLLDLKVLDPAMGSGHFLVEACRFLGEALYEACRLCDELALQAEDQAEKSPNIAEQAQLLARDLRKRVEDLPDTDNELVAYLPSRVLEGQESGPSQRKAQALCRRLVAVHCLYGIDKNPLAVELAKLSIWLESYAEGLPLTFLDHRLICGDSLTGGNFEHLLTLPESGEALDDLFTQGLTTRLKDIQVEAISCVRDLEATIGKDLADLQSKFKARDKLDTLLLPLKLLASAWAGSVMLGPDADDTAYQRLAKTIAENAPIAKIAHSLSLERVIDLGLQGVAFDLIFPEIFWQAGRESGFDAVIGNPPWDTLEVSTVETLQAHYPDIAKSTAGTLVRDRNRLVLEIPQLGQSLVGQADSQQQKKRVYQRILDSAQVNTGKADLYNYFTARFSACAARTGRVGIILPAGFHINTSGALSRLHLLFKRTPLTLISMDNEANAFTDLPQVIRFDIIVSNGINPGDQGPCIRVKFGAKSSQALWDRELFLNYPTELMPRSEADSLLSPESAEAASLLSVLFKHPTWKISFGRVIDLTQEVNQTTYGQSDIQMIRKAKDYSVADPRRPAGLASLKSRELILLVEGKSIGRHDFLYTDSVGSKWDPVPTMALLKAGKIGGRVAERARFYRLAVRESVGNPVTSEWTCAACVIPPGVSALHTAMTEVSPWKRSNAKMLLSCAVLNSWSFDYIVRRRIRAHLSKNILDELPVPELSSRARSICCHSALRLACETGSFELLWNEQLGAAWREGSRAPFDWPVVEQLSERWRIRSSIDALLAYLYGLDRIQYSRLLSTFTHRSFPGAPRLCLSAFDDLNRLGIDAFAEQNDPYWDIPLNEDMPKSVPGEESLDIDQSGQLLLLAGHLATSTTLPGLQRPQLASLQPRPNHALTPDIFDVVYELLLERGEITSRDAQDLTSLDANAVRPLLERLVAEGLAIKEGQRRGTKYRKTGT